MDTQSVIGLGKLKKGMILHHTSQTYKKHIPKMGGEIDKLDNFLTDLHGTGRYSVPAIRHMRKHGIQYHKAGGSIGNWIQKAVSFLKRAEPHIKRTFEHGKNIFKKAKDAWHETSEDRQGLKNGLRGIWDSRHDVQPDVVAEDFSVEGDGRSSRSKSSYGSRKSRYSIKSSHKKSRGGYMSGGKMHKKSIFD